MGPRRGRACSGPVETVSDADGTLFADAARAAEVPGVHGAVARLGSVVAIDLGSCYTRLAVPGRGLVLEQPSVVAGRMRGRRGRFCPAAAGIRAAQALRYPPEGWTARWPIQNGRIADVDLTAYLLKSLLGSARLRWLWRQPAALLALPSLWGPHDKEALIGAVRRAGFGAVYTVPQPIAAALGAPVAAADHNPTAVVHLGSVETEAAVCSLGIVHRTDRIAVGGTTFSRAIVQTVAQQTGLSISAAEAEGLKFAIARGVQTIEVAGIERTSGLPRRRSILTSAICEALQPLSELVADFVRSFMDTLPPELAADVIDQGVVLTGGAALTAGIQQSIAARTGLPVAVAERPEHAVIRGLLRCAEHPHWWNHRLPVDRAA